MLLMPIAAVLSMACAAQEPGTEPSFRAARAGPGGAKVYSFHHETMPVLAELGAGTPVRVVAERTPWSRIQAPGGFVVWVHQDYVQRDGQSGRITTSNVRARPLPSTGAESYPVGQFQQGDAVTILDGKDEWLRVRAPESLGAWVKSASLELLPAVPADWETQWQISRDSAPAAAAAAAPAAQPPAGAEGDAAGFPENAAPQDQGQAAPVEQDAEQLMAQAAELQQRMESARAELLAQAEAAEAAARAKQEQVYEPAPSSILAGYTLVGWLEHQPSYYSPAPYVVVNAGRRYPILPRDGRYDLADFQGWEVAVRGEWRPSAAPGLRVLEISELRVLPKRSMIRP